MNSRVNNIKKRLSKGELAFGAFVQTASPEIVEIVGNAGYDFVWIDCEHSPLNLETAVDMMRAADATGITPIIRVPDHNPSFIMRVLDAGAMGIIVPQVSTREQVESIVSAARYRSKENIGNRGCCPLIRAAGYQAKNWQDFVNWSNSNIMVWLLVEQIEGLNNLDEITQVPGIDAIVLGAFDLSISMGYGGDRKHPVVVAKLDEMIKKVRRNNVDIVALLFDPTLEEMSVAKKRYIEQGCRIFIAGSDRRIFVNGFNSIIQSIR